VTNTKVCRRCGEEKEAIDFPLNRRLRDGLDSWCADCRAARMREARAGAKAAADREEREKYADLRERLRRAEVHWRRRAQRALDRQYGPRSDADS
jgi:hypothetical protein